METYYGHVRTPADAIILFEACRIGLLPRVQRRLSEKERQSIRSGSVFVWDEREAGMRRWTDGKSWSASRVSGSFLTYREMEGKRGGAHAAAARAGKTPESKGSDEDQGEGGEEGPDGYRYKPDGLMKQSFSITTSTGQHLHLISYYARAHPTAPGLNQPSTDPALRHIRPQKGLYPESSINDQQNLPVVTRGPMAGATYSVPPPAMGAYPSAPPPPHPYAAYTWAPPPPMPGPASVPVSPYMHGYLPHPLAASAHHPSIAYGHYPHIPPPHHYPHHVDPNYAHHFQPPPGYSYAPYPSSRSPTVIPPHNGTSSPPHQPPSQLGQADPRLAPPQSESERQRSLGSGEQLPSISQQMAATPADPQPLYNGSGGRSSSATTVPSINALMNGPPPPPPSAPRAEQQQNESGMNGMAATGQPVAAEGPKDIPSEKIGFGEDARALRQLDRVFSA